MFKKEYLDQSGFCVVQKDISNEPSRSSGHSNYDGLREAKHPDFKLWVSDILTIQKPNDNDAADFYRFNNYDVKTVDIYGVITGIIVNKFGVRYDVDDGTGVISCWLYNSKKQNKENIKNEVETIMSAIQEKAFVEGMNLSDPFPSSSAAETTVSSALNSTLELAEWLKSEILRVSERSKDTYERGDTVQVIGKLVDYRGERSIRIYDIREVIDLNEEVDRRFELVHLYKSCYSHKEKVKPTK